MIVAWKMPDLFATIPLTSDFALAPSVAQTTIVVSRLGEISL